MSPTSERLMDLCAEMEQIMDEQTPAEQRPDAIDREIYRYFFARGAYAALSLVLDGERHGLDDEAHAMLGRVGVEIREAFAHYNALETIQRARYRGPA